MQPGVLAGSGRADDAAAVVVWWTGAASARGGGGGGGIAASKQAWIEKKTKWGRWRGRVGGGVMRVLNRGQDTTNQRHGPAHVQVRLDDGYDELSRWDTKRLAGGRALQRQGPKIPPPPPASAVQR